MPKLKSAKKRLRTTAKAHERNRTIRSQMRTAIKRVRSAPDKAAAETALQSRKPEHAFDGKVLALLRYAEKLTVNPGDVVREDVTALTDAGVDDGEVLEANQIIGYFNYVNRCLNGLGVTTEGDIVGYYSSSDSV